MKLRSITLLLVAQVAVLSLWFLSAAVLPEMAREFAITPLRQAALSSAVQIGFVAGALASATSGLSDRYDPRVVFAASSVLAGLVNLTLLTGVPGDALSILARFLTGVLLAGVYPVGMKIAVGWGDRDRGLLVGALVGALTLGSALPHLVVLSGGWEWRSSVAGISIAAVAAGLLCLLVKLGPHHRKAEQFDISVITTAWRNRRVRLAYAGYLGHMWELYAMWAWVGIAATASYAHSRPPGEALSLGTLTASCTIGIGALFCVIGGRLADRFGKADVALIALIVSGFSALVCALTFAGPVWLTFSVFVFWGAAIVPDSPQFSAMVADAAPPEHAGSLMTLQTALGFLLTFFTVQLTPPVAALVGWPILFALLALGPVFGAVAMLRLKRLG